MAQIQIPIQGNSKLIDNELKSADDPNFCKLLFLTYLKVQERSNTSSLEAQACFFRLQYEGDFVSLCTVTFWQKVDFLIGD